MVNEDDRHAAFDPVALYRQLHAHPELSMREFETTALITDRLARLGAETFTCAATGVVGILRNGDGPTVAFRADIDGLPIREETGLPYASHDVARDADGHAIPVMHACGHDSHIACALGAAQLLSSQPTTWRGTAVFVFQPGEETAEGARALVRGGLWDRAPRPRVVLGQHLGAFTAGTIRMRSGDATALADSFLVTIHGRGAHGARPELAVDPIVTAAYCIVRLQSVVSRGVSPQKPVVLTIGTMTAGTKENVIPDDAAFTINLRSPDEQTREDAVAQIHRIVEHESAAAGAADPDIVRLYSFPRCHNDPGEFRVVGEALTAEFGSDNVDLSAPRLMGSEDFGHLGASIGVPSVFWWYGAYRDAVTTDPLPGNHSARFAPDAVLATAYGTRSAHRAMLAYLGVDDREATRARR